MIKIYAMHGVPIKIGRLGENNCRGIYFPELNKLLEMYPDADVTILNCRPTDPDAYPVNQEYIDIDDGEICWRVQSGDLAYVGKGQCEVIISKDPVISKSFIYDTEILEALDGSGDPPDPWTSWQQDVIENANRAEAAANLARNWADGKNIDGTPSSQHSENNAEYWAGQAEASAEELSGAVTAVSELKTVTENGFDIMPIVMQWKDKYVNIVAKNSVTSLTPTTRNGYECAIVPCVEGDEFVISGTVDSGIRVVGFVASDGTTLTGINSPSLINYTIIAPENSAYIVINSKYEHGLISYKGYLTKNNKKLVHIPMHYMGPNGNLYYNLAVDPVNLAGTASLSSGKIMTSAIPCKSGDKFTLNCRGGGYPRAYAFIGIDGTRLEVADSSATLVNYEVTAPANSAFLIVQDLDQQQKCYYGSLNDSPVTYKQLSDQAEEIQQLSTYVQAVEATADEANQGVQETNKQIQNISVELTNIPHSDQIILQGENQYISIGAVGATIGDPTAKTGYQYATVPCYPGEQFLLYNLHVDSGTRVWAFADSNKVILANTNGRSAYKHILCAPENAAYLIVNNKDGEGLVYKGYLTPADDPLRLNGTPIPHRNMGSEGKLYFNSKVAKINLCQTYANSSVISVSLIPCTAGDVFTINARGGDYARAYAFTTIDGTVLEVAASLADLKDYQATAPENSAYLLIQDIDGQVSYFGPQSTVPAMKSAVDEIESELNTISGTVETIDETVESIDNDLYNNEITGWITGSGYINTGISDLTQPVDLTRTYSGLSYRYIILDCNAGDKFIFNINGGGYPRAYAFLDENNLILERADSSAGLRNYNATAPANSKKLVLNDSSGLTSYYGEKSISYRIKELEDLGATPGKLYGKVMVNFGDSIFGRGQGATGISGRIAYKTGATVHNLGMSGTAYTVRNSLPGYAPFELCNLVDAITSGDYTDQDASIAGSDSKPAQAANVITFLKSFDFSTVDYVTIGLGTNDWGGAKTLENANDKYDKTTVCGSLRYSIETLLTTYPKLIIVILSTIPRFTIEGTTYTDKGANSAGYTLQDMNGKFKEIAEEYHLKFIDDFNIGFNKWTAPQYYASEDGTHPDLPGFEVMAENISAHL